MIQIEYTAYLNSRRTHEDYNSYVVMYATKKGARGFGKMVNTLFVG